MRKLFICFTVCILFLTPVIAKDKQKSQRNKYLKNISKIEKMNEKKRIQQRNLEFYKGRLEIKQIKLKNITEDVENEKGEKEE
ncbi:hypothetical protein J6G99_04695 [bacterium]|nr:hypothetical protein [bacterium]